ncbi:MAG TPA: hypothetical protein VFN97_27155 [Actinospica sp.]|nr:hypothetical protein [Actinospica sp.]
MRLRTLGALTLTLAVAGSMLPAASAQAAVSPKSTPGSSATEFYVSTGFYTSVGNGNTVDFTDPTVSIAADLGSISASSGSWSLNLAAPSGQTLAPGTYTGATTYPVSSGSAPGIGLTGSQSCGGASYGSFTIVEITATTLNATFSQSCSSTGAVTAVGFIRYNATTATTVPTLPSSALAVEEPPNSGTTSSTAAAEFSFLDAASDWIGQGQSGDYTGSNTQITGNMGEISASGGGISISLAAPNGQQLVPGTYVGATRDDVGPNTNPGIGAGAPGRGCNQDFGAFTIYQIASDPSTGALTQLNATFEHSCEVAGANPMVGFIRLGATEPTPVPAFLTGSLKPSTGSALSDGATNVTLAAGGNAQPGASYSYDFGDGAAASVSSASSFTKPEWESTYPVAVTVSDLGQSVTTATQWLTVGDGYHAVTPQRIMDTRSGLGATGPIKSMTTVTLPLPASITSANHGPVQAVVLNVTVTGATAGGNVKVYSSGLTQVPATSNVNFGKGQTVANQVTVALVTNGQLVFDVQENPGTVQLIADVEGYYTSGNDATNAGYAALSPKRLIDTRSKTGGIGGRLPAWGHVRYTLPSSVPTGATAVALNVTLVNAASFGDLKVYPDSSTVPNISNLNFAKGGTVPNLVIVQVPASRVIDFYLDSNGSGDLLVDLEGYYSTSATAKFVPIFPTRWFDTRTGFLGGPLQSGYYVWTPMSYDLQVPIPAMKAALYNVTVTQPQKNGNIIVAPDPLTTLPATSNVNFAAGETVANSALGSMSNGKQDFFNESYGSTQLIADLFGYFATPLSTTAPPTTANAAGGSAQSKAAQSTHAPSKVRVLSLH